VLATRYARLEIVVADNASTDDSVAFLQARYPSVTVILLPQNFGFAKGYNEALQQVAADYYVLLNSDVEVQPDWVQPVIDLMEADTRIGACQPKILMEQHRNLFEYAGAAGGWIDFLGYPFARGRIFDTCEADKGQYDAVQPVFWASGAAMFVRASVYHACDGLDEYFFAHMEEIDLCWRIQLAGHRVMVCPQSVVYHVGGGTLPKGNERKVYLNFRNNLIMLWKNLPGAQLAWKLPLRFALDAVSAWKSLLAGEGHYFKAILRAHFSFIKWCFLMKNKHKTSPGRGKARLRLQGYYSGSIIWAYFVQGKRKFSEIVHHKPV
jgi:GT2 family glycosyltransferase